MGPKRCPSQMRREKEHHDQSKREEMPSKMWGSHTAMRQRIKVRAERGVDSQFVPHHLCPCRQRARVLPQAATLGRISLSSPQKLKIWKRPNLQRLQSKYLLIRERHESCWTVLPSADPDCIAINPLAADVCSSPRGSRKGAVEDPWQGEHVVCQNYTLRVNRLAFSN